MMETRTLYKWTNSKGDFTNVWVISNSKETYTMITGYNPFPFKKETKLYTSKEIFEKWMLDNGYLRLCHTTQVYKVVRVVTRQ